MTRNKWLIPKRRYPLPTLPRAGEGREGASGETMRYHLLQDIPLDRPGRRRRITPPPAVPLHCAGRCDEAVRHSFEVAVGIVKAEDQAAGGDPAQGQAFGTQVVLQ